MRILVIGTLLAVVLCLSGCVRPTVPAAQVAPPLPVIVQRQAAPPRLAVVPVEQWAAKTQWFKFSVQKPRHDLYSSLDLKAWTLEKANVPAWYAVTNSGVNRYWRMMAR